MTYNIKTANEQELAEIKEWNLKLGAIAAMLTHMVHILFDIAESATKMTGDEKCSKKVSEPVENLVKFAESFTNYTAWLEKEHPEISDIENLIDGLIEKINLSDSEGK